MDVNRTILRPNDRNGGFLRRAKFSRRYRFVRHIGDEAESCKAAGEGVGGRLQRKTSRRENISRPTRPSPRSAGNCAAHLSGGWGADENRNGARRPAEAMFEILCAPVDLQVAQSRRN